MKYLKNRFIDIVHDKNIALIGSAPTFNDATLPPKQDVLITINGSSLGLPSNLKPDICFFNTSVTSSRYSGRETMQRLQDISAKHLVVVEGMPKHSQNWLRILSEGNFDSFEFYPIEKRLIFIKSALALKSVRTLEDLPSTGFFILLLLLASHIRSIRLGGFSLINGHSYLKKIYKRAHVEADLKVIDLILKHGFPVKGEIMTDGLPIVLR